MKKVFTVLLVVCFGCGMLVGCGGRTGVDENIDATKLPHNQKISIADKKTDIIEADGLKESSTGFTMYNKSDTVKIAGIDARMGYDFNNTEEIAMVLYDCKSTDVNMEILQKFIDDNYGKLEEDIATKRRIIKKDEKAWIIGLFEPDSETIRVAISRDTAYDNASDIDKQVSSNVTTSNNCVLPHDSELQLTDTKSMFELKEQLSPNEYGIQGAFTSNVTWRVENSDYKIDYSFNGDGELQYVTYLVSDSSLSDIEAGFLEVTTRNELQKLYGNGDNTWLLESNGNRYDVTMESVENNAGLLVKIIKK